MRLSPVTTPGGTISVMEAMLYSFFNTVIQVRYIYLMFVLQKFVDFMMSSSNLCVGSKEE